LADREAPAPGHTVHPLPLGVVQAEEGHPRDHGRAVSHDVEAVERGSRSTDEIAGRRRVSRVGVRRESLPVQRPDLAGQGDRDSVVAEGMDRDVRALGRERSGDDRSLPLVPAPETRVQRPSRRMAGSSRASALDGTCVSESRRAVSPSRPHRPSGDRVPAARFRHTVPHPMESNSAPSPLPPEVLASYAGGREARRLAEGHGLLERGRTEELLGRFLPPPPARVLDVGGGPGAHALVMAAPGYEVTPGGSGAAPRRAGATGGCDRAERQLIVGTARRVEAEPSLLGFSAHLLAVGQAR